MPKHFFLFLWNNNDRFPSRSFKGFSSVRLDGVHTTRKHNTHIHAHKCITINQWTFGNPFKTVCHLVTRQTSNGTLFVALFYTTVLFKSTPYYILFLLYYFINWYWKNGLISLKLKKINMYVYRKLSVSCRIFFNDFFIC